MAEKELDDVTVFLDQGVDVTSYMVAFDFGGELNRFSMVVNTSISRYELAKELRSFADSVEYGIISEIH